MALLSNEDACDLTAVAIDVDKNSQFAVRWAMENLINKNSILILIHVRVRHLEDSQDASKSNQKSDSDCKKIFQHYRSYCARFTVQVKEVLLEDTNIAEAIVGCIKKYSINNIVVGESTKNIFIRKLWIADVPSYLVKAAPDFCSLYVVAKGKAVTIRTAKHRPPSRELPHLPHLYSDSEDTINSRIPNGSWTNEGSSEGSYKRTPPRDRSPTSTRSWTNEGSSEGSYKRTPPRDRSPTSTLNSSITSTPTTSYNIPHLRDKRHDSLNLSTSPGSLINSPYSSPPRSPHSHSSVKAEMRRLKQELKQTMEMYSAACKQTISAKRTALEFQKLKIDEAKKFEKRLVEEASSLAKMKKDKLKMEYDAASQRLDKLEATTKRGLEMKAKFEEEREKVLNALEKSNIRYRKYTIEEIKAATENFSDSLKIGEGGYGPVYRAILDHTQVAMKILRGEAAEGMKQFQKEVEILSYIRHPNMVLLLGAAPENGCLIYEYMDYGSLEDRLFRKGDTPPIPWWTRFKIAAEIASGLLFLHQIKPEPLVHRDLKPANILLDHNYNSKISDVGLARLVPPSMAGSVTQYHMTSAAGTFCYIDPEYQQTGLLCTKSDIYSLGIMLLQIITARSPMGLTHHVEVAIERGTFADMLDPAIPDWPVEEALSYAKMALRCAELRRKDRPNLETEILPELKRLKDLCCPSSYNNSFSSYGPNSYSH